MVWFLQDSLSTPHRLLVFYYWNPYYVGPYSFLFDSKDIPRSIILWNYLTIFPISERAFNNWDLEICSMSGHPPESVFTEMSTLTFGCKKALGVNGNTSVSDVLRCVRGLEFMALWMLEIMVRSWKLSDLALPKFLKRQVFVVFIILSYSLPIHREYKGIFMWLIVWRIKLFLDSLLSKWCSIISLPSTLSKDLALSL